MMNHARWNKVTLVTVLLALLLALGGGIGESSGPALILSLGEDGYIPKEALEGSLGVQFLAEPGEGKLEECRLVILSNIDLRSLPGSIRNGLMEYARGGGSLLITGGDRSYGSGGYQGTDLASLMPFALLYPADWQPTRRGLIELLNPGHPAFSGLNPLRMPLISALNNVGRGEGSQIIAQLSKFQRQPLMAEKPVGGGWVFGISFNMAEVSPQWGEANPFLSNLIRYLSGRSTIGAK